MSNISSINEKTLSVLDCLCNSSIQSKFLDFIRDITKVIKKYECYNNKTCNDIVSVQEMSNNDIVFFLGYSSTYTLSKVVFVYWYYKNYKRLSDCDDKFILSLLLSRSVLNLDIERSMLLCTYFSDLAVYFYESLVSIEVYTINNKYIFYCDGYEVEIENVNMSNTDFMVCKHKNILGIHIFGIKYIIDIDNNTSENIKITEVDEKIFKRQTLLGGMVNCGTGWLYNYEE